MNCEYNLKCKFCGREFEKHKSMTNHRRNHYPYYQKKLEIINKKKSNMMKLNNPMFNKITVEKVFKKKRGVSINKGTHRTIEGKKKISEAQKKYWQNPEYREKIIKSILKGLIKRPTSLEYKWIRIFRKHNLPYKYVGDGSFLIGWKNPDFVQTNGKKICIEVRARKPTLFWSKCSPEQYEEKQRKHYLKYGWNCIVIFDS